MSDLDFINLRLLKRIAKRWPGVYKWCQKQCNGKKNRKAIVYVLCQIDKTQGIKCYHAYANKIMSVENGNFNEQEHQAKAAKEKRQSDSIPTTLATTLNGLLKSMD